MVSTSEALNQQARLNLPGYDVFLSQAIKDKEVVLGIYATLVEDIGLTVFCDWLEAPKNDHAITTPREAAYLRTKLQASTALVFIDSEHAETSTWMSWEIGWFDAAKGRICVLPVVEEEKAEYRGREFLGLYPVAEHDSQHFFMVSVPLSKVAARHPPGTALGIATRLPLGLWASMECLPTYFLR
ncbi:MAG: hypothetical protein ABII76_00530 [Pseudomonadota bacterium]